MSLEKIHYRQINSVLRDLVYDLAGSFCLSVGIACFVNPSDIAPGGVSGISIMIHYGTGLPIGFMTLLINLPILWLGFRHLGGSLITKTVKTVVINTIMLDVIVTPFLPKYQGDRLLGSVFGGILMGVGLAIVFLHGSTTAGTDILSYLLQKRFPVLPIGRAILLIDSFVIGISMFVFQDIESGLFGVISLFCSTKTIDTILYGMQRSCLVTVFSRETQKIADCILSEMERGATLLEGKGAYTGQSTQVLYCVIRKHEFAQLKNLIYRMDENAFVVASETDEVLGEGFKPAQAGSTAKRKK